MRRGKEAFSVPVSLMRSSSSATMRSHSANPDGRITCEPFAGPFSASWALAMTSWYQRGKSSLCDVSTFAMVRDSTGPEIPARAR